MLSRFSSFAGCFTVNVIDDRQQEGLENFRTIARINNIFLIGNTDIIDNDG